MATAVDVQPSGVAAISRAVVAAAAELVAGVERAMVGESKIRTARGNAWDAIQADRARAQAREEMDQLVRALLANGPHPALNPALDPSVDLALDPAVDPAVDPALDPAADPALDPATAAQDPNTAARRNTRTRTRTKTLTAAPH